MQEHGTCTFDQWSTFLACIFALLLRSGCHPTKVVSVTWSSGFFELAGSALSEEMAFSRGNLRFTILSLLGKRLQFERRWQLHCSIRLTVETFLIRKVTSQLYYGTLMCYLIKRTRMVKFDNTLATIT